MIDPGADRQEASGPDRATVAASERAECERLVRSRAFLAVKAPTGLIESLLWRWLTARDRLVAEFIFPNGYVIGNLWRQAYGLLLFAAALSWIVARYAPGWWNWIVGIGIFVAGLIVTRCVLSSGAAFRVTTQGATTIPYHACYGLGYTELSRVLFKHSLVQLPLLVPFCAACALLAGPAFGWPPAASTLDGVKAAGLLLALRPLGITMSFSSHSNDTSGFRPRSVVIFTSMAVLGIAFIGLGAGSLPFPTAPIACICWLVAMVAAGLLFLIHRWFYNTNRFDLIGVVQR